VSASSVRVASRVVNPTHDQLRPAASKELYQLRPAASKELYQLRPAASKELYQLRPTVYASCLLVASRFVNPTRMSCIAR
jgi:hypothetical protein